MHTFAKAKPTHSSPYPSANRPSIRSGTASTEEKGPLGPKDRVTLPPKTDWAHKHPRKHRYARIRKHLCQRSGTRPPSASGLGSGLPAGARGQIREECHWSRCKCTNVTGAANVNNRAQAGMAKVCLHEESLMRVWTIPLKQVQAVTEVWTEQKIRTHGKCFLRGLQAGIQGYLERDLWKELACRETCAADVP
eukprot:1137425-Pelagomonas_calceolata.AAC.3